MSCVISRKSLNLYALLIGVDCYLPNELSGGGSYPCLGGAVRDILYVEEFLQRRLGMTKEHIFKLTSTCITGETQPPELPENWPTYENMITGFKKISDTALPGDQVYIHYCGHGGRTTTQYPGLKGEKGIDEALVPMDIGNSEARYLRDIEMAYLLKSMVEKGLVVTILLDCCHSGGATRGKGGAGVRGIGTIDTTPRPEESLVASHVELTETWQDLSSATTRNIKPASGWLLEPTGYVLLAACRASEFANEYAFDGTESNGALTYWFLDSLKQMGAGLTYKQVHDHVVAKIHGQFEQQTPQLQGEGNRVVFGSEHVQPHYAVNVMQVDSASQRVLLNAGQVQGMRKGIQFAIYPPSTTDFTQTDQRLALVDIAELGATDSWSRITKQLRSDPIEQGAQAVMLDPSTSRLRRTVCLVRQDDDIIPSTIDQNDALERIDQALAQSGSGFVTLAEEGKPADYQVAVNSAFEYEIWDPSGKEIKNLRPALRMDDGNAPFKVVQRLIHLTKYRNVNELDNNDIYSPLANKLVVELTGVQQDYDPVDRPEPQPFIDSGNTPMLNAGEWTFLRIMNKSLKILNITVLDLQPDWGINQIYPRGSGSFEPLDPGQSILLPLEASLPAGYTEGTDLIKVFATLGTTNFRWLELPALDQPVTGAVTRGGPANPLEELLAAVTAQDPKTRNLNPAAYPSWEWVTAQVEARVHVQSR